MWLAEVFGGLKGEDVDLQNARVTAWIFDPHAKVRHLSAAEYFFLS